MSPRSKPQHRLQSCSPEWNPQVVTLVRLCAGILHQHHQGNPLQQIILDADTSNFLSLCPDLAHFTATINTATPVNSDQLPKSADKTLRVLTLWPCETILSLLHYQINHPVAIPLLDQYIRSALDYDFAEWIVFDNQKVNLYAHLRHIYRQKKALLLEESNLLLKPARFRLGQRVMTFFRGNFDQSTLPTVESLDHQIKTFASLLA